MAVCPNSIQTMTCCSLYLQDVWAETEWKEVLLGGWLQKSFHNTDAAAYKYNISGSRKCFAFFNYDLPCCDHNANSS